MGKTLLIWFQLQQWLSWVKGPKAGKVKPLHQPLHQHPHPHPHQEAIMTLASVNVFFQLKPTTAHSPLLENVETVRVGTRVRSGAMWMAKLEITAATPNNLVVESSGHLKPALPLMLGQASALTNSAVYTRTYSR